MSEPNTTPNHIELAAEIVSAFVSNNAVPSAELPTLIANVHQSRSGRKLSRTRQL